MISPDLLRYTASRERTVLLSLRLRLRSQHQDYCTVSVARSTSSIAQLERRCGLVAWHLVLLLSSFLQRLPISLALSEVDLADAICWMTGF